MTPAKNPSDTVRSLWMRSLEGLAQVMAVVAAYLGTPWLYGATIEWMQRYTLAGYGPGFEDLVTVSWFVICSLLIYFLARATLSTALVMGGAAIITRFMM